MWGVIIHSEGETVVVISRVTEYSASSKHTDVERVHQCELVWPNYALQLIISKTQMRPILNMQWEWQLVVKLSVEIIAN